MIFNSARTSVASPVFSVKFEYKSSKKEPSFKGIAAIVKETIIQELIKPFLKNHRIFFCKKTYIL